MKVKRTDFLAVLRAYGYATEAKHQRLVQWLVNRLLKEPCPEIFYETDNLKAKALFERQYVED